MAFINQLSEKLEAQQIYDGLKGKYETRFRVEEIEYAFIAKAVAGDRQDNTQWMLEFENIKAHRIGRCDDSTKVVKAFAEAVDQWVKDYKPYYFYTYGSNIDSLNNILEAVKKKVKGYSVVDPTLETKDESGNVIEGNPVGKIVWTKVVEEAVPSEEQANTPQDKLDQTYEEPKDIKTDKKFMSGTSKSDKLDKGDKAYDLKKEFAEFKEKKLNESQKVEEE